MTVHTPQQERLIGHADQEIWQAAQKESRFLITQDLDFSDSRRFPCPRRDDAASRENGLYWKRHSPAGTIIR